MAEIRPVRQQTRSGKLYFIRSALGKDALRVLECAREIITSSPYSVVSPEEFHVSVPQEIEFIESFRKDPGKLFLVVETADRRIVGTLDFSCSRFLRQQHTGEFGMGVIPEFQGEGIGSALLSELLDWAIGQGNIEKINLSVHAENARAIALYRKFEFEQEGVRKREVKRNDFSYSDMIQMARLLR